LQNSKQLDQAQGTEKHGTWAQCSIPSCGKWRFLQNDVDPQDLPERWICSMNESKALFSREIAIKMIKCRIRPRTVARKRKRELRQCSRKNYD